MRPMLHGMQMARCNLEGQALASTRTPTIAELEYNISVVVAHARPHGGTAMPPALFPQLFFHFDLAGFRYLIFAEGRRHAPRSSNRALDTMAKIQTRKGWGWGAREVHEARGAQVPEVVDELSGARTSLRGGTLHNSTVESANPGARDGAGL